MGAIQDLLRGIEKLIGAGRFSKEGGSTGNKALTEETMKQLQAMLNNNIGGTNLNALLKRGMDALEDKDFDKAKDYYDQALNIDAESGEAFFGLYLAEHGHSNLDSFSMAYEKNTVDLFDKNLQRAIKNATGELKALLENLKHEREMREAAERKELDSKIAAQKQRNIGVISELLKTSKQVTDLSLEIDRLMSGTGDGNSAASLRLTDEEIEEKRKLAENAADLAKEATAAEQAYRNHPNQAEKRQLESEISEIKAVLPTLGFFQGKKKKELEAKLPELEKKLKQIESILATTKKEVAEKRKLSKDCETQLQEFDEKILVQRIFKLNDEKKQLQEESIKRIGENPYIGFGTYPYKRNGEKAPIEWIVIELTGENCSMISRYCLAVEPYKEGKSQSQWDDSSIRKWLNQDFFNDAFTDAEKELIIFTELNYSSQKTKDRVYLLSRGQADSLFTDKKLRKAQFTPYSSRVGECPKCGAKVIPATGQNKCVCSACKTECTYFDPKLSYPLQSWWLGSTKKNVRQEIQADYMTGSGGMSFSRDLEKLLGIRPVINVNLQGLLDMCQE